MTPKLTLSIATFVGLIFSLGMFFAPEFVTKEQFPNSEGQGFEDLVTLRYALASVIFALATITFHLRNIEGLEIKKSVMRGYTIAFSVVFLTNLVLHISQHNVLEFFPAISVMLVLEEFVLYTCAP